MARVEKIECANIRFYKDGDRYTVSADEFILADEWQKLQSDLEIAIMQNGIRDVNRRYRYIDFTIDTTKKYAVENVSEAIAEVCEFVGANYHDHTASIKTANDSTPKATEKTKRPNTKPLTPGAANQGDDDCFDLSVSLTDDITENTKEPTLCASIVDAIVKSYDSKLNDVVSLADRLEKLVAKEMAVKNRIAEKMADIAEHEKVLAKNRPEIDWYDKTRQFIASGAVEHQERIEEDG